MMSLTDCVTRIDSIDNNNKFTASYNYLSSGEIGNVVLNQCCDNELSLITPTVTLTRFVPTTSWYGTQIR